ncbi:MAG: hypothetical protein P9L93_02905 [Candidatus Gorgyraea atricola]|nr:hypothetical protein [Candidatus Gorgyraea atricola]
MPKYIIDFEFAGHVEVESKTEEEGKEVVEKMSIEELSTHIQHFNVGKHYIKKVKN